MVVLRLTLIYLPVLIKWIKSSFATEYIVFLAVYQHKKNINMHHLQVAKE